MLKKVRFSPTFLSGSMRKKVLLVAFLLAAIPVLIMGMTAYYMASDKMIEMIGEADQQTMLQIQQRIDEKMVTLEKIALQNAANPTLSRFLSLQEPEKDIETLGMTMTILSSIQVLIEDVDSVYLYRPDQQLAISSNQGMIHDNEFPAYIKEAILSQPSKIWLDHKLESIHPRKNLHQITLIQRINTSNQTPNGYLIIHFNDSFLFKMFANMQLGARELLIITPTGNIFYDPVHSVMSNTPSSYNFYQTLMQTDSDTLLIKDQVEGRQMSINYVESRYNGWKYVTMIPYAELTAHLQKIKEMTILICLSLMLLGIIAAGMLSRRWHSALHSLLELIRNRSGVIEEASQKNELTLIRQHVESLCQNNEQLGQQVYESMPLLRANFMTKLLTEPFHTSMLQQARYYQIPDEYSEYTVLCIELDNTREQSEQDSNLFHYAVMNIAREVISQYAQGSVIRLHSGHIVTLINHDAHRSSSSDPAILAFQIAEEIREVSERLLHMIVTTGIGRSCESLALVRTSYREALEALQYQLIEGSGRVLFIGQIKSLTSSFIYPYEIEQQLITHLKLANLSQICNLLDAFVITIKQEITHHEYIRQSFAQLIAASLRTLFELEPAAERLYLYNPYHRLNEWNTLEKIICWLKDEFYPPLVEAIHHRTFQRNHTTIQTVLTYIHEHYDTDLCLPFLAEMIGMPVSQFSHVFKTEVGMPFSDYLLSYRMDRARQMLESTDVKIAEIAAMLCYNNSQNFIRVFKKQNGMTPGEYRTRCNQKQII